MKHLKFSHLHNEFTSILVGFFYIQTNLVSFKVQMKSIIMEDIRVTLNKSRKMILHTFPQSSWIESALIA